jgi:hypothetical protein
MPTKKKDEGVKETAAVEETAAAPEAPEEVVEESVEEESVVVETPTDLPEESHSKFLADKLADGKYRILKSSVVEDGSVVRFKTEHGSGYTLPRAEYDAL